MNNYKILLTNKSYSITNNETYLYVLKLLVVSATEQFEKIFEYSCSSSG